MKPTMTFWLLITLTICFSVGYAQDYQAYYTQINKGNRELEYSRDTAAFIAAYEKAFADADPFIYDQVKLVNCYVQQKDWNKTAELLEKLMRKGYPLDGLRSIEFQQTLQYSALKQKEKECFISFIGTIDFDLYKQMKYLSSTD